MDEAEEEEIIIDYNYIIEEKPPVEDVKEFLKAQIDSITFEADNKFELNHDLI